MSTVVVLLFQNLSWLLNACDACALREDRINFPRVRCSKMEGEHLYVTKALHQNVTIAAKFGKSSNDCAKYMMIKATAPLVMSNGLTDVGV
jgi:hypothetical protein